FGTDLVLFHFPKEGVLRDAGMGGRLVDPPTELSQCLDDEGALESFLLAMVIHSVGGRFRPRLRRGPLSAFVDRIIPAELRRQRLESDLPPGLEHEGTFDHVLELADVAWPAVGLERLKGLGAYALDALIAG